MFKAILTLRFLRHLTRLLGGVGVYVGVMLIVIDKPNVFGLSNYLLGAGFIALALLVVLFAPSSNKP